MLNEYWSGWMGFSMIYWIVLLLLIVFGMFKALSKGERTDLSAKQVQEARYARGEINKVECERLLKDLKLR